jgi:hypothetical protein
VQVVVVAPRDAVHAQHPELLRLGLVVRHHHPTVAVRAEVLGGVKAEAAQPPQAAHRPAVIGRADRLGAIFHNLNAARFGQRQQFPERCRLSKQMNGDDRSGAGRDLPRHVRRIEIEGARVDVGEHQRRAHLMNGLRRRDVGEWRGDDLIARAEVEGAQRQGQGVRAGVDADPEAGAGERGNLFFEGLDVRA